MKDRAGMAPLPTERLATQLQWGNMSMGFTGMDKFVAEYVRESECNPSAGGEYFISGLDCSPLYAGGVWS